MGAEAAVDADMGSETDGSGGGVVNTLKVLAGSEDPADSRCLSRKKPPVSRPADSNPIAAIRTAGDPASAGLPKRMPVFTPNHTINGT